MLSAVLLFLAASSAIANGAPETANYISASGGNKSFGAIHREGQIFERSCSFDSCRARSGQCEDQEYLCAWTGTVELAVPRNVWTVLPEIYLDHGRDEPGWTHGRYHYTASPPAFGAMIVTSGTPLVGPIRFLGKEIQGVLVTVTEADDSQHEPVAWFLLARGYGVVAFQMPKSTDSFWLEGERGVLVQ